MEKIPLEGVVGSARRFELWMRNLDVSKTKKYRTMNSNGRQRTEARKGHQKMPDFNYFGSLCGPLFEGKVRLS